MSPRSRIVNFTRYLKDILTKYKLRNKISLSQKHIEDRLDHVI